jgi:hypothetical protein
MRKSPSGSYPPPLVRLAILRAVAKRAGIAMDQPAGAGLAGSDVAEDDDRIGPLLACVPAVAAALTALEPTPGRKLLSLGAATAQAYSASGSVAAWRAELLGVDEPIAQRTLDAARFCAAAGVGIWEQFGGQPGLSERLAPRLRTVLPLCQDPGTRAGDVAHDADDVTQQLLADLYQKS